MVHPPPSLWSRIREITVTYFPLGYITFGGPNAHVALLHELLVVKKEWVDDLAFSEILSLVQALPGPMSTELAYSIALVHGGLLPAIWGFLLWSMPGFIVMSGVGLGISFISPSTPIWAIRIEQGLGAAAVGLVALAGHRLAINVAYDQITKILLLISAGLAICYTAPWLYPAIMTFGGSASFVFDTIVERRMVIRAELTQTEIAQSNTTENAETDIIMMEAVGPSQNGLEQQTSIETLDQVSSETGNQLRRRTGETVESNHDEEKAENKDEKHPMFFHSRRLGAGFLLLWAGLLVAAIIGRGASQSRSLQILSVFYVVGSIILGGGPVVVPLLQGYTVEPGWLSEREFLVGLALIQALPGPNFNLSGYLGALALRGPNGQGLLGSLLAYVGIYLPGLLLKNAVIPYWQWLRTKSFMKKIFRGINACAIGLVFAAIWLLWTEISQGVPTGLDPHDGFHLVVAAVAYVGVAFFKIPSPLVIIGGGTFGILEWAVTDNLVKV